MQSKEGKSPGAGRFLVFLGSFALTLGGLAIPASAVGPGLGPFVEFAKVANDATIEAGDVARFTISGTNTGGSAANSVVVTDVLPDSGLAWAENPDVPQCSIADDPGGDVLTCSFSNFAVGASFSVTVEAVTSSERCDYVLSNTASLAVNGRVRKTASASISVTCVPTGGGCTFTQGFWKNHPEAWPVSSLTLGSVSYSASQLSDILDEPVNGNGLISLAHQLIAAKLNVANGADPTDVQADIAAADALIGSLVVPPIGSGFLDPGDTSSLVDALTDFNEGISGPGHCPEEE